jgi:hypothetical protein
MSPAASGVLRALLERSGVPRDRVLLTNLRSVDWQSLTFTGERHELELRITGPDPVAVAERMTAGLSDAEFQLPRHVVADIGLGGEAQCNSDGSVTVAIEALTISG